MSELLAVLDSRHRRALQRQQVEYRLDNEFYMREHPEFKRLVSHFMYCAFKEDPEDMMEFAVRYFCQAGLKFVVEEAHEKPTYARRDDQAHIA
jgi:hypothetical protein